MGIPFLRFIRAIVGNPGNRDSAERTLTITDDLGYVRARRGIVFRLCDPRPGVEWPEFARVNL
jgi:hypothetical protein